jgi:hypothetical protein
MRDLGLQPSSASVIGSIELSGPDSVPAAVINHLYPLKGLLRHVPPMLTAVPCIDYLWLVGGVPPGNPTVQSVQERESGRSVRIAGVLMGLRQFFPGVSSVGAMDNDKVPAP